MNTKAAKDHNKSLCLQGRVVENISKRCGGFLRKLSLRGCLGVGDSALRWERERMNLIYAEHVFHCKKMKVFILEDLFSDGGTTVFYFFVHLYVCIWQKVYPSNVHCCSKVWGQYFFFKNVVLLLNFLHEICFKMTVKTFIMFCLKYMLFVLSIHQSIVKNVSTLSPKCEAAQLFSTLIIMRFISILEWILKDHVTLKTGEMMLKIQLYDDRNKLHFKIY